MNDANRQEAMPKDHPSGMKDVDNAPLPRRHEIDALRSIALLLLIGYHVLCAFQPFAPLLQIVGSPETLERAWVAGELMNTWRIPVLFLLAGITAGYLLCNRSVAGLLKSRLLRLVPPLLFTVFLVSPVSSLFFQFSQGDALRYAPGPAHLWFVWNLVVYFVLAVPLFHYLKACPDNRLLRLLRVLPAHTWLPALAGVLALVTVFLEPHITPELFSAHFFRFWYGLACFLFGILLVSIGEGFWQGIRRVCHVALAGVLALYLLRMSGFDLGAGLGGAPGRLTALALESACGMIAFLGYGSLLFSRRSRGFAVLNRSVFAIYILHFPVQQAIGVYLFPAGLPVWWTFALHLGGTLAVTVALSAMVLRWGHWLHPFLGIPPVTVEAPRDEPGVAPATAAGRGWVAGAGRFATLYVVSPLIVILTIVILVYTMMYPVLEQHGVIAPGE